MTSREFLPQKWRFIAFVINAALFYLAYVWANGRLALTGGGETLWLLAAWGWWGLSLVSAPWYRPPRDALAAGVAVLTALWTLDLSGAKNLRDELAIAQLVVVAYATCVSLLAVVAVALEGRGRFAHVRRVAYDLANSLASGESIFGAAALISIFGFYEELSHIAVLVALWVGFALLKPVELLLKASLQLSALSAKRKGLLPVGIVQRVDHPNIVRVVLNPEATWGDRRTFITSLPGRSPAYVLPLFTQAQGSDLVGTGICCGSSVQAEIEVDTGQVYEVADSSLHRRLLTELAGDDEQVDLVGFVVEGSTIATIRFETASDARLEEGTVVCCSLGSDRVFYQILDALTAEESFKQNPRGTHIVIATQLGTFDELEGFRKFAWLPGMNSAVFRISGTKSMSASLRSGEFIVGYVPSTDVGLKVNLPELVEYHSAILGVTGTGKTELALDVVREAIKQGTKVFCVDLTGEYRRRLGDLEPKAMGLTRSETGKLDTLLFEVETGEFKASAEKKALREFVDGVRVRVTSHVDAFLSSDDVWLGLFELAEVTNTRATLRTTELFLSEIMAWARKNRKARRILIVLEEAHTIIPETYGAGFDSETQWVVGRIGQIALQGRKYGVGLLIVSQRTALVSKTILSQCNTYFTHSLVDQTSLSYLSNIYGADHIRVIPNLRFLEFVASGKAVRSDRPLLVHRQFDEAKVESARQLDRSLTTASASSESAQSA